jgi:L-lactate utilization protein LutB
MSTLDTAKQQLDAALARLEACLTGAASRAKEESTAGEQAEIHSRLMEDLTELRAEHERLTADLQAIKSERDTQKQINRSVVDALDIAIGRLDTILAE